MRGLAIFTVVYSHLLLFCTEDYEQSGLTVFLRTFVLSGFFFLSGYLTKRVRTWNIKHTCEYIWRKFTTLFIPTLVCGGVYIWTHGISLQRAILDDAKYGYWFTFTLFMMCGFYAVTMYAICLFKCERKVWAILSAMALVSLVLSRTSLVHGVIQAAFSFSNFTLYLPFFIIGILCRRYSRIFNDKILGTSLGKFVVFIVVTLSYVIYVPSFLTQFAVVFLVYFIAKQPPPSCGSKRSFCRMFCHYRSEYVRNFFLALFPVISTTGLCR